MGLPSVRHTHIVPCACPHMYIIITKIIFKGTEWCWCPLRGEGNSGVLWAGHLKRGVNKLGYTVLKMLAEKLSLTMLSSDIISGNPAAPKPLSRGRSSACEKGEARKRKPVGSQRGPRRQHSSPLEVAGEKMIT